MKTFSQVNKPDGITFSVWTVWSVRQHLFNTLLAFVAVKILECANAIVCHYVAIFYLILLNAVYIIKLILM